MNKNLTLSLLLAGSLAAPLAVRAHEGCEPGHKTDAKGAKASMVEDKNLVKTSAPADAKSKAIMTDEEKQACEAKFPEIKRKALNKAMKENKVFLIDANGSESYAKAHIPGAVDFESTGDALTEKLPQDKNALVVAYCGGPGCMAWSKAAKKLEELGYTNVKHYKGGIKEWKSSGMKVESAQAAAPEKATQEG